MPRTDLQDEISRALGGKSYDESKAALIDALVDTLFLDALHDVPSVGDHVLLSDGFRDDIHEDLQTMVADVVSAIEAKIAGIVARARSMA
jgi:hypothetical protein